MSSFVVVIVIVMIDWSTSVRTVLLDTAQGACVQGTEDKKSTAGLKSGTAASDAARRNARLGAASSVTAPSQGSGR